MLIDVVYRGNASVIIPAMSECRAVLFDADGVIITPQELFARQYAREHRLDPESFEAFFRGDFLEAITGKTDLKDLIKKNNHIWQWDHDPQELLDKWFAAENVIDEEIMAIIARLREDQVPVFLATNQERYRTAYLREVMFPDKFDEIIVSSEMGATKSSEQYWTAALGRIALTVPNVQPEELVFFDDSQSPIDGALNAGLQAHLYKSPTQVRQILGLE